MIDAVAPTLPALLKQLEGYKTTPKGYTLDLAGAEIEDVEMSLWKRILDALIDPNIITLLLSLGTLGLIVEMWNPGLIFPGTVGAICLVLGLFGLSVLPVSAAGIAADAARGALLRARDASSRATARSPLAAIVAFVLGLAAAVRPGGDRRTRSRCRSRSRSPVHDRRCSWRSSSAKLVQITAQAGRGRRAQPRRRARRRCAATGLVFVNGELWQAHRADGRRSSWATTSPSRASRTASS